MFYINRGEWIPNPDSLVRLQSNRDVPSSESKGFLFDIQEEQHYRWYSRTCQDYSYKCDSFLKEYKCQVGKRKNKSALSLSLSLSIEH